MNTTQVSADYSVIDDRIDRLVNLDIGGRGVEHLYAAAREQQKGSLIGAAADRLAALESGSTVLMTTGSVSRAWISTEVGENDGPAGAAIVARALSLAKRIHCVVVCEQALIGSHAAIFRAAGLSVLPYDEAKKACQDGTLAAVSFEPFPVEELAGIKAASELLDRLNPALLFSSERVGRAADGIYYSMRAVDYSMGRARVDWLFDEGLKRGIPTVCVGDGGNEIGMGLIRDAVRTHVKFGDCIGAITSASVLVTAACSNWGCSGIVAALALRFNDRRLLNTPCLERALLERGVDVGLINSFSGAVDPDVDGIELDIHMALVKMLQSIVLPHIKV